ncbi:hypothetical protein MOV66_04480 [Agrobacterium sp. SHOUNA12C]|nr:hypothetical protein [Agrobacterium sp. BETTINA12B]MCJ9755888.1 hypothetical protein [Agrobacterium sp. SHOUNA12C]
MYHVFDPFLARDTWHTSHALDDKVFYICLEKVVTAPGFNPDQMREQFITKRGDIFRDRIDNLTMVAWGIKEYQQAVG